MTGTPSPRPMRRAALAAIAVLIGASTALAPAMAQNRPAPPASAARGAMTDYVIRGGDTLIGIGERLFTRPDNWRQVQTINRVADPYRLQIGSVLRIPTAFLRVKAAGGRIVAFQGRATVSRNGSSLAPRLDQTLAEGDVLETGPNAYLRLVLSDGGAVIVPSNTRMRIDRLRVDVLTGALDQSFSVLNGRIESRVAPVRNGGAYTVRTPVSVSAVRGTVFRTGFDADLSRATASVLEGAVDVEAGQAAASVSPNQGAVISAAGLAVKPLPARPYLTDPDTPRSDAEVAFDVVPVPGAVAYRALIASDPELVQVTVQTESEPGQARLVFPGLPDGFHYLSISAVTADGLEGPASVYDFLRVRNAVRDLAAEPIAAAAGGRDHLFHWASDGASTPRYRFQLGRPGEAPLIDREGLQEAQLQIADLAPGDYVWRVRASRTVQGQLVDVWSPPQTLVVRP
ncbi:MAG: FecR domain-containing protein [Brevundimonas sp.]|uniref:FecR domain-containing protein n=1 Tax=Brevundimonas sp. TaxID=1871086 RepID=UPI004034B583